MTKKHIDENIKLLALNYYLNNKITQIEISKMFNVDTRTFRRWMRAYKIGENLTRKKRKYISYKLKEKHVKFALKILQKDPTISIERLWTKVSDKFKDFEITPRQLNNAVRDNNITRKRNKIRHYPTHRYGKKIDTNQMMKTFYSKVKKYKTNDIISIDETSIHAYMKSNYCRSEIGKRCVSKTTNNKVFQKFTLVVAISSKGIVGFELYQKGGMTSERMISFIKKYIDGKYNKKLIIMDNGGSHKNKAISEHIEKSGNKLLYSVPYRPKTNVIESWFSQFKSYFSYKDKVVEFSDLKKKVIKTIRYIKKVNYKNYFEYAYGKNKPIQNKNSKKKQLKNYKK